MDRPRYADSFADYKITEDGNGPEHVKITADGPWMLFCGCGDIIPLDQAENGRCSTCAFLDERFG